MSFTGGFVRGGQGGGDNNRQRDCPRFRIWAGNCNAHWQGSGCFLAPCWESGAFSYGNRQSAGAAGQ